MRRRPLFFHRSYAELRLEVRTVPGASDAKLREDLASFLALRTYILHQEMYNLRRHREGSSMTGMPDRKLTMKELFPLKRPPKPPRETARIRQGLSVRVDAGLLKAFQAACKTHKLRSSDLMETILWNALGEPPLSFEPEFRGHCRDSCVSEGTDE